MPEISRIKKGKNPELDVLVVGMNPSLSRKTYKQLYERLKKRKEEGGLEDVLNQLRTSGSRDFADSLGNDIHWNQWVEETFSLSNARGNEEVLSKLQYYFVEGKEKPESELSWPVVSLEGNLSTCQTITYFDTIRRTLVAALNAMKSYSQRNELTWYQIDLFHKRETVQASFLLSLKDGKNWNSDAEKAVVAFWNQVERLKPKVLLVANSNVSDLIFTNYDDVLKEKFNFGGGSSRQGFGKELYWDKESFALRIKPHGSEHLPKVVFSRQLSGGASNSMLYYVAKEIARMLSPVE